MNYYPLKKGTLLIPSGTAIQEDLKHLFVICTDPCIKECVLIIPICSWKNDLCDKTCIINPNYEHEFIIKPSYVLYRNARIEPVSSLIEGVNRKIMTPRKDINSNTFLKIVNGICRSPQASYKIKKYYGCEQQQKGETIP